jgi:hypothetical protein
MKKSITLILLFIASLTVSAQTVLTAGDMAIIGVKTSGDGNGGNDAIKLITFVALDCNTRFILTDNNWNAATGTWFCGGGDAEWALEISITSPVDAGTIFKIDAHAAGGNMTVSTGTATKVGLGGDWGTNFGLNSGGDNAFILQGTRATPTFIFGWKNCGAFSLGGSCTDSNVCGGSNKNNTGLPPGLTIGTTAIQNAGELNRPYYNCAVSSGTKNELLTAICNTSNWTNAASSNAGFTNFMACSPTVTDAGGVYASCGVFLSNNDVVISTSCKNKQNEISWHILDETKNISNLVLECGNDDSDFKELTKINKPVIANKLYNYIDKTSKKSVNYRIRYTDANGFTQYSNIISSSCKTSNEFSIYPNPAKNLVNINITYLDRGANAELLIYNVLGEIVYKTDVSSAQKVLVNSEHFSQGIYYVVLNSEKDTQMQKLVITN